MSLVSQLHPDLIQYVHGFDLVTQGAASTPADIISRINFEKIAFISETDNRHRPVPGPRRSDGGGETAAAASCPAVRGR